ncbi:hypothetical protein GCM10010446_00830 [Streptomyces enissocaesilis]|uniref:Uncharacterized protein n=1 Tax=Streptomyces enissocaesilis TaxID=332589 RepID=A0ABN3WMY5_9ACTN
MSVRQMLTAFVVSLAGLLTAVGYRIQHSPPPAPHGVTVLLPTVASTQGPTRWLTPPPEQPSQQTPSRAGSPVTSAAPLSPTAVPLPQGSSHPTPSLPASVSAVPSEPEPDGDPCEPASVRTPPHTEDLGRTSASAEDPLQAAPRPSGSPRENIGDAFAAEPGLSETPRGSETVCPEGSEPGVLTPSACRTPPPCPYAPSAPVTYPVAETAQSHSELHREHRLRGVQGKAGPQVSGGLPSDDRPSAAVQDDRDADPA